MNKRYFRWYSERLNKEMEIIVYGSGGTPVLVFPTSGGRHYDWEGFSMINALEEQIVKNYNQIICVDSVDYESWYNKKVHPAQRVARHLQYESYIINEVIPFIHNINKNPFLIVAGCSFGGFHAALFALRNPYLIGKAICMSGDYDTHSFFDGYYDDECYFVSPLDFLPNLSDPHYINAYNKIYLILAAGEWDICRATTEKLSQILANKNIKHYLDIWWGEHHDWPLWHKMIKKYIA